MNSKAKNLSLISNLIDVYGKLLTKKQLQYIKLYYFEDLSLNELSSEFNVSKNAIYDSICKSIKHLKIFEKKLKLIANKQKRLELYKKIDNLDLRKDLENLE